tara:strand:- start:298 stop:945 length:648 start_codon:yes stop_codon:yes gene_type:complete
MALTTVKNSGLSGSIDLTSKVTGALPVGNGGTGISSGTSGQYLKFTGSTTVASAAVSAGITGYDKWKLGTSFTGDAQPITSNLSRCAYGEFSKIGTGMSESSGVFTFPETGLWKIGFQAQFYGDTNAYGRIQINWSTNSGASYTASGWADTSSWGTPNGNFGQYRTITSAILNVTDASTWRVTVEAEQQDDSDGSVYGAAAAVTFLEFTRLADSQ